MGPDASGPQDLRIRANQEKNAANTTRNHGKDSGRWQAMQRLRAATSSCASNVKVCPSHIHGHRNAAS